MPQKTKFRKELSSLLLQQQPCWVYCVSFTTLPKERAGKEEVWANDANEKMGKGTRVEKIESE